MAAAATGVAAALMTAAAGMAAAAIGASIDPVSTAVMVPRRKFMGRSFDG
jgi:hypothetical protein